MALMGICIVCGEDAESQCDDCQRWLCYEHLIVEAQAWDVHGFDGVDFRCHEHRRVRFDTRDLLRERYLPEPASEV